MFVVSYEIKNLFFDRPGVIAAVDCGERVALSKIGAFIRRRARTSLRRRKGVSPVGSPPSVHSSDKVATLKNILFAFNLTSRSVVIGPVGLNQKNFGQHKTIPELMEFGGDAVILEEQFIKTTTPQLWFRRDLRKSKRPDKRYRSRRAQYAARPFMGPALASETAAGTIGKAFEGVVR